MTSLVRRHGIQAGLHHPPLGQNDPQRLQAVIRTQRSTEYRAVDLNVRCAAWRVKGSNLRSFLDRFTSDHPPAHRHLTSDYVPLELDAGHLVTLAQQSSHPKVLAAFACSFLWFMLFYLGSARRPRHKGEVDVSRDPLRVASPPTSPASPVRPVEPMYAVREWDMNSQDFVLRRPV
jgi:hypothetical protein